MTVTDLEDAYDDLRRVVGRIVTLRNDDVTDPFVQAFTIVSEYTSVDLDRENKYGISVVSPPEQLVTTTRGLALSLYNYHCVED